MTRYIYLVLACVLMSTLAYSQSQSIQGRIYDAKTNEGLPFANVILLKDGIQKTGTTTDLDGNYSFTGFDPGLYDVEAVYVGYPNARITGVRVSASQSVPLDLKMNMEQGIDLNVVTVTAYEIPLIKQDETASGNTLGGEDIKKLPTRDVTTLIATTGGVSQDKEGEDVSFRGAREGDQIVYVDGVRVRGSSVPAQDIEQIQVITGGIPAAYGDVTGGVTNIITKGAASKFSGSVDLETSEGLDGFGYNFATASVSGPIWKRTITGTNGANREETILGFRLSGQFVTSKEPSPSYLGAYRAKQSYVDALLTDPGLSGEFNIFDITADDVERQKYRENARDTDWTVNGKIDFVPVSGMSVTLGGQIFNSDAKQAFQSYSLLNYDRNPSFVDTDWRAFARFRHTIGGNLLDLSDEEVEARTSALIQNINYSLQFDITQNRDVYQDPVHEDRLFDYGYVGNVERGFEYGGYVEDENDPNISRATAFSNPVLSFTPGNINPAVAAYYQYDTEDLINNTNGGFSTTNYFPYNLFISAGFPFNEYFKRQNNQYGISASGGFDIIGRGGDNPSKHSIQFGIYYEQRVDRSYIVGTGFSVGPYSLWQLASQRANLGVGVMTPAMATDSTVTQLPDGTIEIDYPLTNASSVFGQNLRNSLGLPQNAYVNVDGLTPDQLSLDMFSTDELINGSYGNLRLNYTGYDYTGNILGTDVTFNDFFTERDGAGNLTRPVAAQQPIYAAAYIQDKFSFKDIYFNLGVRVDRYDANQNVLADPFSIYATSTVSETTQLTHPENVGDDFIVYGDQFANTVTAYREGEQWYDANGNAVNSPTVIFGTTAAVPYLDRQGEDIKIDGFDPSSTFVDYEPQITVMPRISFSFPLNENAGFFAHYDILSRRPGNNIATALDYYYFTDRVNAGSIIGNPNLKPSKTIDYQVGFQQKLSNSSALKISAYYREQRDEVNQRQYLYAYPTIYSSYGNRDFGTVKGFTFAYDLRRTNNLSLKANYTLQFADGTGSNANSTRNAQDAGDIRVIYPYDFDQRHNIVLTADYRYGEGSAYNGPVLFNKNILANTGLNVLFNVGSGRPYTPKGTITRGATAGSDGNARGGTGALGGTFNGARLPWTTRIDMRLDRDIRIGGPDNKNAMYLNVYVRTQNLLNTENIVQVFGYTQSPSDDGWLVSPDGQTDLMSQINPATYTYLYGLRAEKGAHYGFPRRIRAGLVLSF